MTELLSAEALRRYDDSGDPVYSTFERVLIALRWFDWCTAGRLFEAIGIEDADELERRRHQRALAYWFKHGRIEKRGEHASSEYRLIHPRKWTASNGTCRRCPAAVNENGAALCDRHLEWQRVNKRARRAA